MVKIPAKLVLGVSNVSYSWGSYGKLAWKESPTIDKQAAKYALEDSRFRGTALVK